MSPFRSLSARFALIVSLFAVSCASSGSASELAGKLNGYTRDILPEYKAYLEADMRLEPSSRQIRKKHADELQRLINEALGRS
ncbi:MAG: hypothetical protein DHS20C15_25390 [Planctomycetota bacterium]|nr:MAG: hypothetical protein DHS20C15_25390 [Planctomycetota bacterium]